MISLPPPTDAIAAHSELRDLVAAQIHRDWSLPASPFSIVATKLLGFGFNTYKVIGLLLPDRHYEQGTALLRTLWETCANFAWIQQTPDERAVKFLGFTAVEFRKFAQHAMPFESPAAREEFLLGFDEGFGPFIRSYRRTDRRGHQRWAERFSGAKLDSVVRDLSAPWLAEYRVLYPLMCHYTHGSPGAVIFPLVAPSLEGLPELYRQPDDQRTTQLALWSMAIMVRLLNSFLAWTGAGPDGSVMSLDQRIRFSTYLQEFCERSQSVV